MMQAPVCAAGARRLYLLLAPLRLLAPHRTVHCHVAATLLHSSATLPLPQVYNPETQAMEPAISHSVTDAVRYGGTFQTPGTVTLHDVVMRRLNSEAEASAAQSRTAPCAWLGP